MSEDKETHEDYVERKLAEIDDHLMLIVVFLLVVVGELALVLYAIHRLFPGIWGI
jgi:hypothetical protein